MPDDWRATEIASTGTSLAELMFDPEDMSFPVQDTVRHNESGQGYALRMAAENSLSGLPQVKNWLGKSRFAVLDADDASLLHKWFGADKRLLEFALGRVSTSRIESGYVYAGQSLGRSYFLNRSYPRVCPTCLKENGCCQISWDLSLVVACAKHGTMLIDLCDYCQRALTWSRPQPTLCSCGMDLTTSESKQVPTPLELQFATWVAVRLGHDAQVDQPAFNAEMQEAAYSHSLTTLMTLLWPLSLDGGFRVAYALGTAAGYDEENHDLSPRLKTPLRKAQRVLQLANALAEKISRSEHVQFRVIRPTVVVQLLAESTCAQGNAADQSLAYSVLAAIFHNRNTSKLSSANPGLSQLSLF